MIEEEDIFRGVVWVVGECLDLDIFIKTATGV